LQQPLCEASEFDPRCGGFLNGDLAEECRAGFKFNSAGAKGWGEVSMIGVSPAIATAH
jgi:xanthine dehydrogenase YagR molybdenum-binding subunit